MQITLFREVPNQQMSPLHELQDKNARLISLILTVLVGSFVTGYKITKLQQ